MTKKDIAALKDAILSLNKTVNELKGQIASASKEEKTILSKMDKAKTDVKPVRTVAAKQTELNSKKQRFELWSYDEYGQGYILASDFAPERLIDKARRHVTDINMNNALTPSEKMNSWEAYFPEVFSDDEKVDTILYAGNRRNGKHHAIIQTDDGWEVRPIDTSVNFRMYLGEYRSAGKLSQVYLQYKNKFVSSLEDPLLARKSVLFIKVV